MDSDNIMGSSNMVILEVPAFMPLGVTIGEFDIEQMIKDKMEGKKIMDNIYIKDNIEILDNYAQDTLSQDSMGLLITILTSTDNDKLIEEMVDGVKDDALYNIFIKRINAFDLSSMVDKNAWIGLYVFDIVNPGAIIIYLIRLLEFYDEYGRAATINDICTTLFPTGFYNALTVSSIIDVLIKPKVIKFAYIY